jgi:hypothetical protein
MYFINHEEEINSYIKEKFMEDYQNSTSFNPDEIPYITINDIDNTSIKELEERVELIRMEKEQKLIQTKKA